MKSRNQELQTANEDQAATGIIPRRHASIPLMGLNDSLVFMGKPLHVQTESRSAPPRCIVTEVFSNGRVVLMAKSEIPADFCKTRDWSRIRDLMQAQHLDVIQRIRNKQAQSQMSLSHAEPRNAGTGPREDTHR